MYFWGMLQNSKLASVFEELAQLKELAGENTFAANAYRRAAQNIEHIPQPFATLAPAEQEQLLGKSMATKAAAWVNAGKSAELEALRATIPAGVLKMLTVPGFGVKKVGTLWRTHGITDFDDLVQRAETGTMAELPGFGKGTQEAFLKHVETMKAQAGKCRLDKGMAIAEAAVTLLAGLPGVSDAVAVGDVARSMEIIDRVEVLVGLAPYASSSTLLAALPDFKLNRAESGPGQYVGMWSGAVHFTLYTCPAAQFAKEQILLTGPDRFLALQAQTGATLRAALGKADAEMGEYELLEKTLGFYLEPELRDDPASAPKEGERLIELSDIRGILHCHSTYSDGQNTLREMATHCRDLGYAYFGISDHSQTATYAHGLEEERVLAQWAEIDVLNAELAPFKIYKGIESDILPDGSLDYPPGLLAGFDYVVASVHSGLKMSQDKAMERLLRAVENPYTNILGHATGRLLLEREGYPLDYETLFAACAAHKVSIEINASPWRLDLDWRQVRRARELGVIISINPDAHKLAGFGEMTYGVATARKGGLLPSECLNTLSSDAFADWLATRRKG
jgi:DNA polymerase (family 10)